MLDLGLETRQNTDVFRSLVFSELADALKVRDKTAARGILMDILPDTLHNNIPELLDGLV
jgi:precorrin-2 dehydrogenase/sirohydrochlorin ferrochelatase